MLPPDKKDEGESQIDWGEIYTFFVTSTNIKMEEIPHKTYPQIKAIMSRAGKYMPMQWGIGGMGAGSKEGTSIKDAGERTIEDTQAFVSLFSGIE